MRAKLSGSAATALAILAFLASLSLVAWRQAGTRATLARLDALRHERAVAEAQGAELAQRVRRLESRERVVRAAGERLGMHLPEASEIVILPGEAR